MSSVSDAYIFCQRYVSCYAQEDLGEAVTPASVEGLRLAVEDLKATKMALEDSAADIRVSHSNIASNSAWIRSHPAPALI